MKKTSLIVALLIVLTLALSACAPKAETAGAGGFRVAYLTDLGGLSGSEEVKNFSDLGWDAALQAVDELGIEAIVLEANELADLEPNIVKMAEEGYDLLVCGGYLFSDAVSAVAPNYPDTMFAVIDGYASGDNVQNIGFASNEGSFLVGALAAGMTETGTIAFIGGMEGPLIEAFEAGYIAGARAIDPEINVISGYTGSFTDVAAGKELAMAQNGQDADIIYAAAGNCGLGTIEAAEEQGFYAIGVDVDQDHLAPNNVLSSMLKHVEVGTFITIKQAFEGNFQPGYITYTLADGTIGYTKSAEMANVVPAELYAAVDALADKINAGEIVVPITVAEANAFTLE